MHSLFTVVLVPDLLQCPDNIEFRGDHKIKRLTNDLIHQRQKFRIHIHNCNFEQPALAPPGHKEIFRVGGEAIAIQQAFINSRLKQVDIGLIKMIRQHLSQINRLHPAFGQYNIAETGTPLSLCRDRFIQLILIQQPPIQQQITNPAPAKMISQCIVEINRTDPLPGQ